MFEPRYPDAAGAERELSRVLPAAYRTAELPQVDSGWIKVKTAAWRETNRDRWEVFERRS